jgi:hypothetical protein
VLQNKIFTLKKGSPMNLVVALTVEQHTNKIAVALVVVAAETVHNAKCTLLFVPLVALKLRFLSVLLAIVQYSAEIVSAKIVNYL